jgi:hypothetical protein
MTRQPCDHDQRRQGFAAPECRGLDAGARRGRMMAGRLVARIETVARRIAASPNIGGTTRKPGFLLSPVGTV